MWVKRGFYDIYPAGAVVRHVPTALPLRSDSFQIRLTDKIEHILTAFHDVVNVQKA